MDQGALWGAARVVGEEHPDLWGGLVDLDPPPPPRPTPPCWLVMCCATTVARNEIAARPDGTTSCAWRATTADVAHEPFTCREDAAYLITGGFGGVGCRSRGRWLIAAHGDCFCSAARLCRHATMEPPCDPASVAGRRIAAVRALEALGVAVHIPSVDVSDEAALCGVS